MAVFLCSEAVGGATLPPSQPGFAGIETIRAGAGDAVVDLTSSRWGYGDVTVEGEAGNDVPWTSSGNGMLLSGMGSDTLDAHFGRDRRQHGRRCRQ
mgnify:CR=1 FL=1